jgi:hypothetical protein
MAEFGISSVEPSGSAIIVSVQSTASRVGVTIFHTALRSNIKKYVDGKENQILSFMFFQTYNGVCNSHD